jgi:molecular chaperone DnaK (HSP70)
MARTTVNTGLKSFRVVAAIDFGTYGTGFAWAVVSDSNTDAVGRQIYLHTDWPSAPYNYPKTRTCLLLDDEGNVAEWGFAAHRMWRQQRAVCERRGLRYVQGFKMSLAGSDDDMPSLALHDREPVPVELVTKYLEKIYTVALERISQSGFTADDVRWCLTVPAMWDDYQKQAMRDAASAAGFPTEDGRLLLALEPEAAAHYARVAGVNIVGVDGGTGPSLITPGSRFVVADFGGGTGDTTAYRSEDDGSMIEIGRVCGDKAGSYYLNRAFERRVLIPRLGGPEQYERLCMDCPSALEELLDGWERAKITVTIGQRQPVYIPLPFQLVRHLDTDTIERLPELQPDGIDDGIAISPEDIHSIFEDVVPVLVDLVDKQLDEMRRQVGQADGKELVLLVGGFAASPYLQDRLAQHLADRATVLTVPEPGAAVLRGAVHFAYEPQTRARRSKYTYAMCVAKPFDRDRGRRTATDWTGQKVCLDSLQILVRAGDIVRTDQVVETNGYPLLRDQKEISQQLYRTLDREPRYITDPGCVEIGRMTSDIAGIGHLHIGDRGVRTALRFGETQISATATVRSTGVSKAIELEFHPL